MNDMILQSTMIKFEVPAYGMVVTHEDDKDLIDISINTSETGGVEISFDEMVQLHEIFTRILPRKRVTMNTIKNIAWESNHLDHLEITLNNDSVIILTPENIQKIAEFIIQYNWD